MEEYELNMSAVDKEVQEFLDKHPNMTQFINRNMEVVLDNAVNCILNILS